MRPQSPQVLLRGVFRALLRGGPLEQRPDLVDLRGLLRRGDRDDRPLLRDRRHETLRGELAERLANRRPGDADPFDQLPLDEPLTRPQPQLDDLAPQEVGDLLAQRRRDPLDLGGEVVARPGLGRGSAADGIHRNAHGFLGSR